METEEKTLINRDIQKIIIDFDNTICAYHLHHECLEIIASHPKKFPHRMPLRLDQLEIWDSDAIDFLWEQLAANKKLVTTGNKADWRNIFLSLIENDYQVMIASFNSFKPIIERFLKEIVSVPSAYLAKICIEAWLPQNQSSKNAHIDRILGSIPAETDINFAVQLFSNVKRKELYKQIILIDDVSANTDKIIELVGPHHALNVVARSPDIPLKIMQFLSKELCVEFAH